MHTTRPAAAVLWTTKPGAFTVAPGGNARGGVTATNLDSTPGTVPSPGCPVLVGHPPVLLPANLCPPAGRHPVLAPHKPKRWGWGWYATSDGTSKGTPLPAGNYTIKIGGATVPITVT